MTGEEFFRLLQTTECIDAQIMLGEIWRDSEAQAKEDPPYREHWEALKTEPVSQETVLTLVASLRRDFRERLYGISDKELYTHTHQAGHTFFQWMAEKAREAGVDVFTEEVDLPITPTDLMVASGAATLVTGPNGEQYLRPNQPEE